MREARAFLFLEVHMCVAPPRYRNSFRQLRLRGQSSVSRQRVKNLRVALCPGVVDRHTLEAPFLAVEHQLTIVTIHQESVLRTPARTFPGHEMLRHEISRERGRIVTDLDLEIAGRVTGIERTDKWKNCVQNRLTAGELGEIEPQFSAGGSEIEKAIFRQGRCERISITVVQTKGVAMQGVGNLITVGGQLRQIGAHWVAV